MRFVHAVPPAGSAISIECDGQSISAFADEPVASALLRNGSGGFRKHPVTQLPRLPFCLMGVCFECLVEIDGHPSKRACQVLAEDGMVVRTGVDNGN